MSAMIDIAGQVFGRLTVRSKTVYDKPGASDSHRKKTWWLCDCSCGGMTVQPSHPLRTGMVASCGCLRRENGNNEKQWDGESFERLRAMWFDPSMSIAAMGAALGVSKNAAKGAADRIGLPNRQTFLIPNPTKINRPKRRTLPVCQPEVPYVPRLPLPKPSAIDLFNWMPASNVVQFKPTKPRQCEFLDGDTPKTFVRCEHTSIGAGKPYCAEHHAFCYQTNGRNAA